MNLQTLPDGQLTQRFKLAREAAEKLGHGDRFSKGPLAVTFSPEWNYQLNDPFNPQHSKTFTNAQGQQQGTCIHLGNCDIGCDVRAKNTLDLNYIPLRRAARRRGAAAARGPRRSSRANGGYRVVFDRIEHGRLVRGEETRRAGVSRRGQPGLDRAAAALPRRAPDAAAAQPRCSAATGARTRTCSRWRPTPTPSRVQQTIGPTIASGIDFMDGVATASGSSSRTTGFRTCC